MKPIYHASIPAELEAVKPYGDFVLVRRADGDGERQGLIVLPQTRKNAEVGARIGEVIAAGPGDKLKDGSRAPMHVKAGDRIVYHRAPANVTVINGVEYTFIHEEQHLLAVLED